MEEPPDDEIVAHVRRGDEGASRRLVELLYPTIASIVRKHLPRREEEEDLIQEVFMKLFAKMDSYAGKQPIAHWASRIAINTCYDRLRRQKVRPVQNFAELDLDEAEFLERALHGQEETSTSPEATETATELLEKLLATLNPRERIVIRMLDLEEKTIQETCNLTGWGASKVKVTAHRARRKLRATLARLETNTKTTHKGNS
mgnify:CR=1 FL=1